jgi:hypothetical protein
MAIQSATYLTGKINNIVFYQRLGTYIARALPATVTQSAATRVRSNNFGVAAAAGSSLRCSLQQALPFPKNKIMQSRFSGAIARWLALNDTGSLPTQNDLPFINEFSFNEATAIKERWKLPLTVTRVDEQLLQLQIPAFTPTQVIAAPAHTAMIVCRIIAASCNLQSPAAEGSFSTMLFIPYTDISIPALLLPMALPVAAGYLVVTVISFTYLLQNGEKEQRPAFMPSGVIDARYC